MTRKQDSFANAAEVEGLNNPAISLFELQDTHTEWRSILSNQLLKAHFEHQYRDELVNRGQFSHAGLRICLDGGGSRMRVHGEVQK